MSKEEEESKTVYEIKYKINLVGIIDEHVIKDSNKKKVIMNRGTSFFETCCEYANNEMDIFETKNI